MSQNKAIIKALEESPLTPRTYLQGRVILSERRETFESLEDGFRPGTSHSLAKLEEGLILEVEGHPVARGEIVKKGKNLYLKIKELLS